MAVVFMARRRSLNSVLFKFAKKKEAVLKNRNHYSMNFLEFSKKIAAIEL